MTREPIGFQSSGEFGDGKRFKVTHFRGGELVAEFRKALGR